MSHVPAKPKLLLLELWGLGDLTFATAFLRSAVERYDVTLVAKPHAQALLAPTFPQLHFIPFDAPWTVFRGKYRLWKWPWKKLWQLFRRLRREKFDTAVTVRPDPRDHLLMRLAGARERCGFPAKGSGLFLHHRLRHSHPKQHKVEDWRQLAGALGLDSSGTPFLDSQAYRTEKTDALFAGITKPVLVLHPGARIAVRRWPEPYFENIVRRLRAAFDFHLLLVPDPDGYGRNLAPLCDQWMPDLTVGELVNVMGRMDFMLCNDSGPGHLAAACGRPAIVMFGPTDPDWFRPFGGIHRVVIRDICALRPCFDYCKFPEPYCMTKLLPEETWPEIQAHILTLIEQGVLSRRLLKGQPS